MLNPFIDGALSPCSEGGQANALYRNDVIESKVDLLLNVSNMDLAFLVTCLEQARLSIRPLYIVLDLSLPPCPRSSLLGGQQGPLPSTCQ